MDEDTRLAIAADVLRHYTRLLDAEQAFRRTSLAELAEVLQDLQETQEMFTAHLERLLELVQRFRVQEIESRQSTLSDVVRPPAS